MGFHVALIMDGNGRWARARGLPRSEGHRAGAGAVRRSVEAAPRLGVTDLTLYAFSSDNWGRPPQETDLLMRLFLAYLRSETPRLVAEGVRLSVIGRRDRIAFPLFTAIGETEEATRGGGALHLRLGIDYSAREEVLRGAAPLPDVDLLVRTGGERRLSDFLLLEFAYAELVFLPKMWPDFGGEDLTQAVAEFQGRERRFGRLPEPRAARL